MTADITMLGNRIKKNMRHLKKWAKREDICSYRIYDRDIPEFPLAIDWYDGKVHVSFFRRSQQEEEADEELWFKEIRNELEKTLEIDPDMVFIKYRELQKRESQYERVEAQKKQFIVEEKGLKFLVNLSEYIDTGLFLDHRITRSMVKEEAQKKKVLNLYGYTGSFSVYAAAGGAFSTTTVDLSNTYLKWAKRNLELNKFSGMKHRQIKSDVFEFLRNAQENNDRYDLIICDPPTFSKSKSFVGVFDVQRDHAGLLNAIKKVSVDNGVVYFSTNFKKFRFQFEASDWKSCDEITSKTVPEDFKRKRPHRAWRLVSRT